MQHAEDSHDALEALWDLAPAAPRRPDLPARLLAHPSTALGDAEEDDRS